VILGPEGRLGEDFAMTRRTVALLFSFGLPAVVAAAGVPLLDAASASHGT
jgi:hypothetical protein